MPREAAAPRGWPCADARELARWQRAMQRALAAPDDRADARAAAATGGAPEAIAFYRRMIALRFAREVAREYPATRALLGVARFAAQARAFAARRVSTSYTLDGYARAFPEQLARAGGDAGFAAAAELARLERECAEVAAAPAPGAGERCPGSLSTGARAPLAAAPGARVAAFAHDVDAALASFERGAAPLPPRRAALRLALFRRGAATVRLRVSRAESHLLRALLAGEALPRAVARGVAAGLRPPGIARALERWVAAGLLRPAPDRGGAGGGAGAAA